MTSCLAVGLILLGGAVGRAPEGQGARPPAKLADGVYAVQRDSLKEKDLLPVQEDEVLLTDRHRYQAGTNDPPRFLVVHTAPDVSLDLAGPPRAQGDGPDVLRILLKLKPGATAALEKVTRARLGKQLAIVLGGEVVTVHKVREVIRGGDVQITACAPGSAPYLFERLKAHYAKR
jgi:preprotein translocase subunit SecD